MPSIVVSVFSIWIVQRLASGREREKAVFDLYKTIAEAMAAIGTSAADAWGLPAGPKRAQAIAATKWKLQQLGASVERLRLFSRRRRWRWGWPLRPWAEISMRGQMLPLRREVTSDPFEDPSRRANKSRAVEVERAIGDFHGELDRQLFEWLR